MRPSRPARTIRSRASAMCGVLRRCRPTCTTLRSLRAAATIAWPSATSTLIGFCTHTAAPVWMKSRRSMRHLGMERVTRIPVNVVREAAEGYAGGAASLADDQVHGPAARGVWIDPAQVVEQVHLPAAGADHRVE